jgi:predicted DNA-binding ribbon-helix-helix protein
MRREMSAGCENSLKKQRIWRDLRRNPDTPVALATRGRPVVEREKPMGSPVLKRSVVIGGHKTSVSLEDEFWSGLKEIAAGRNMTLSDLVATVERGRESGNLSSSLRLFVLESYRQRAAGRASEGQNGAGAVAAMPPAR